MEVKDRSESQHRNSVLERHFQSLLLSVITAALIGFFVKVTNMSDNIIIIKEKAVANKEVIDEHGKAINRLQMNDLQKSDRIIKLEIEMQEVKDKVEGHKN
jgi:type IV secretory pathway protease TraF